MTALDLLDRLYRNGDQTAPESSRADSDLICQEGTGCDCRGCPNSG